MEFLNSTILNNTLQQWAYAAALSTTAFFLMLFIRWLLCRQFSRLAKKGNTVYVVMLAVLKRGLFLFFLIVALAIGSSVLTFNESIQQLVITVLVITILIQVGLWANAALRVSIEQYRKEQQEKDPASLTTLNVINFIGRIVIWATVLLVVLDNLGVNITALVAGLGIGGVAVALALQTILGDLFASLSIVLDKPFVVGDFLIVGDLLGSVEYVGLKTTRLRSLSGEQLVFSNSDLLNSRIRNFGRMFERRVSFDLGVTYQTPREKLQMIPDIIRQAIEGQEHTRFDRSHFKEYGDFALTFESVYFIKGPDYNRYMDIQQAINLHIHERFEQEGIEFAYPTQTLFVSKGD